uniref:Uncharacterized protein n=1 Tax=Rhizophora mucronata TaxID=61149 RepID=A0A2P2PG22_RHIMU
MMLGADSRSSQKKKKKIA